MHRLPGKNLLQPLVASVLVFVIVGIYALVIADSPCFIESGGKKLSLDRVFNKFDYPDWLAEDETNNILSYNLLNGIFRDSISDTIYSINDHFLELSVQAVKINHFSVIKDHIQIKLLI